MSKSTEPQEEVTYHNDTNTYGVYTIYDKAAGDYGPIFIAPNHEVARRYFRQSIKDVELYGDDFDLRMVGLFRQPLHHPDRPSSQDRSSPLIPVTEFTTITVPPKPMRDKFNIPDRD